ncbi:unnamed protein product [Angiostrongylus costaricensis]|uniref:Reverse transcriptase domain-containing protein n=1 Tax=Angiostrongylus costaricensis TaxID=334426 RepID=A0A0R3PGJ4_ANGCS|nr:unnamed protein product [Angiostrongylus costaricensis]
MGVKIDGWQLHNLRFADDIVLIIPNISEAECMLSDFDKACAKIGLQLNLTKTMFMKNGLVSYAPFTLNRMNILSTSALQQKWKELFNQCRYREHSSFENISETVPSALFLCRGESER